MSPVVLLDAGPLGLVTNPRRSSQSVACTRWLQSLVSNGTRVILPEIADYEVRRELLRAEKVQGLSRLDALANLLEYLAQLRRRCDKLPHSGHKHASRASLQRATRPLTPMRFWEHKPLRWALWM